MFGMAAETVVFGTEQYLTHFRHVCTPIRTITGNRWHVLWPVDPHAPKAHRSLRVPCRSVLRRPHIYHFPFSFSYLISKVRIEYTSQHGSHCCWPKNMWIFPLKTLHPFSLFEPEHTRICVLASCQG